MTKILIVDDRALNRKFLLTLLGYNSHELLEAADGAEALEKARAERPDLVITDLLMPTMDGFELVQRMRAEPAIAATPVIFYTATYRLQEARELARACGVSVVIPKPSAPHVIVESVNGLLHGGARAASVAPAEASEHATRETRLEHNEHGTALTLVNRRATEWLEDNGDRAAPQPAMRGLSEMLDGVLNKQHEQSLKLAALLELGLELAGHRDPERLLDVFCRAAVDVMGARYGVLGMLADDGRSLCYFHFQGSGNTSLTDLRPLSPRAGILDALLRERRPCRVHNPSGDPQALGFSVLHPPVRDFLGVPISSPAQVYGWLYLVDKLDGASFDESDEQVAATLAAQLAVAYEAVRLYDEVQRHAARLEIEAFRRKEAEEKFCSAIQAAPNGMLMVGAEGKIVLVNSKMVDLFGYGADELIGQPIEILLPERLRRGHMLQRAAYVQRPHSRAMGEGRDLCGRRKDGSEFPVEIGLNPLATSEGVMILGSVIDISQRKRAEAEARQHFNRIRALHEIGAAITSTLDLGTVLTVLLEKLDLFFGAGSVGTIQLLDETTGALEPVAARNVPRDEWIRVIRDGQAGAAMYGNRVAASRRPLLIAKLRPDRATPSSAFYETHRLVSYAGVPLIAQRQLLGVLAIYTHEERAFSSEDVESLMTLARQAAIAIHNARLFADLKSSRDSLAKANRFKSEFLSFMSHELRTPLHIIMGYSAMLVEEMTSESDRTHRHALDKVQKQADDLLGMVNSIMQATAIESDSVELVRQDVDPVCLLEDLRSTYDFPREGDVILIWDYPMRLPRLATDGEKLKHVLQNLINNALKFTDRGSVTIGARAVAGEGSLGSETPLDSPPAAVRFEVSDTGIGISQESLPLIFDMFKQVDSSTTRQYGGVGLGLYMVKKFTELLGGKVAVRSELGKGSAFSIEVPLGSV